jgi:hypothetical protein
MTHRILFPWILFFPVLSLGAADSYPSGSEDIDRIRKEIDLKPTDGNTFRERTILLYNWMGALQQQGADLRPFYEVDKDRRPLETLINRAKDEELKSAHARMGNLIDRGYKILEEIQRTLVEEGPMFEVFESDGKGFPEGGEGIWMRSGRIFRGIFTIQGIPMHRDPGTEGRPGSFRWDSDGIANRQWETAGFMSLHPGSMLQASASIWRPEGRSGNQLRVIRFSVFINTRPLAQHP